MFVSSKRAVVSAALALLGLGAIAAPAEAAPETGWRLTSLSPGYSGDYFTDIAVTSANDAWAVGHGPCCDPEGRAVSHWDGVAWQPVTLPAIPEGVRYPALSAVGASSADDVWVFGEGMDGPSFGQHWDGAAWQSMTISPGVLIKQAAVVGPDDAWVTGLEWTDSGEKPVLEHYDGEQWTRTALPDDVEDVDAISADSASDVWVTGYAEGGAPVSLHWDGSALRTLELPTPSLDDDVRVWASDIVAAGPQDAWATGVLTSMGVRPGAVLWHWNGKRWKLVPVDAPQDSLTQVAPDGGHGVWLVSAGIRTTADLLHYADGTVTRQPAPVEPETTADIRELVRIPGTRSLWGAGSLTRDGDSASAVFRYDPES
jgi:hypothetical protein